MTTTLIQHFSLLKELKSDDFLKSAEMLEIDVPPAAFKLKALQLLQNYERLKELPLEAGMFVNEPRQPKSQLSKLLSGYETKYEDGEKVLFKGFAYNGSWWLDGNSIAILFNESEYVDFELGRNSPTNRKSLTLFQPTIGDFITEITRYNRTAQSKISIEVSEQFVKAICK